MQKTSPNIDFSIDDKLMDELIDMATKALKKGQLYMQYPRYKVLAEKRDGHYIVQQCIYDVPYDTDVFPLEPSEAHSVFTLESNLEGISRMVAFITYLESANIAAKCPDEGFQMDLLRLKHRLESFAKRTLQKAHENGIDHYGYFS